MVSASQLDVVLSPITDADLVEVVSAMPALGLPRSPAGSLKFDLPQAEGNWAAFPTVYGPIEHPLPHAERLATTLHRLRMLLASPSVLPVKATVGTADGPLAGIAIWHRVAAGEPIFHLKRHRATPEALAAETDADRAAWAAVNDGWEAMWGSWDKAREEIMGSVPHLYLAPLWVHPQYQGRGIGAKLLQQQIDLADKSGDAMYLEASRAGQPVYERRGFVVEGKSEGYPEMVRWGTSGGKNAAAAK